jgi:predicted CXXCH cytochrome family protein
MNLAKTACRLGGLALLSAALTSPLSVAAAAGGETVKRTPTETLSIAGQTARIESGRKFFGDAKYAGSDVCKSCHEKQHAEWSETWHAKMERWPSADVVIGDFNDRVITYKDIAVKTKDGKEEKLTFQVKSHRQGDKFFFTVLDKDNTANNQTFEIAKVLGGKWDQHYEIKIGENYLPAPIRWSVAAKDWLISSYRPYDWVTPDGTTDGRPLKLDELPKGRFAEAKCSGCHTTGFEFYKDAAAGHWKAKENGKGELGIGCERCHGPASKHVAEAEAAKASGKALDPKSTTIVHPLKDLSTLQQTQVCAQCHGRNTNKKISDLSFQQGFLPGDVDMTGNTRLWSYSGTSNPDEYKYFWPNDWAKRNRQQVQDFSKSAHAHKGGMSCLTCHTFHGKAEGAQLRQKPEELCATCHSGSGYAKRNNSEMFAGSPMAKAGVQCVDCHMPKIGYRSDKTASSPHPWDVSSHTFMVATPAMEKSQGIRSSCASCHEGQGKKMANGAQAPAFDNNLLDLMLKQKQSMTRTQIDEVEKLLAKVPSNKPLARKLAEEARGKLNFVLLDGSFGFHNQEKATAYIAEAKKLAERAVTAK